MFNFVTSIAHMVVMERKMRIALKLKDILI